PQVMKGYWKSADATSQTIVNGWLHTGDLGYMDEDGSFYYIDRKKDIINVGGLKVWPAEVEGVLYECPSVSEVVVGSESDQYYGEVVTAWVVLKSGYDQLQEEKILKEYCISKLARYKVPNRINFVTEIPKSPVGKLLRRAFRQSGS
ncbi:MAG: AMP-binding protein, partial [Nitrososphaerota archaeon]|nr:AMP-binding protein [Nitrososphaerota archaeon]